MQHAESNTRKIAEHLADELYKAYEQMIMGWQASASTNAPRLQRQLDVSIPASGFELKTVLRLLTLFGRANYMKSMPMAMLFKQNKH